MPQGNVPIDQRQAGIFFAFGHEQLPVGAAAIVFTPATYIVGNRQAQVAYVTCEDANIRYRYDGTDPTATTGHLLFSGETLTLAGPTNIASFSAIRAGGVDGEINVTYEG